MTWLSPWATWLCWRSYRRERARLDVPHGAPSTRRFVHARTQAHLVACAARPTSHQRLETPRGVTRCAAARWRSIDTHGPARAGTQCTGCQRRRAAEHGCTAAYEAAARRRNAACVRGVAAPARRRRAGGASNEAINHSEDSEAELRQSSRRSGGGHGDGGSSVDLDGSPPPRSGSAAGTGVGEPRARPRGLVARGASLEGAVHAILTVRWPLPGWRTHPEQASRGRLARAPTKVGTAPNSPRLNARHPPFPRAALSASRNRKGTPCRQHCDRPTDAILGPCKGERGKRVEGERSFTSEIIQL
eukprot:360817-Chlamydomonas_euryale.AAC.14